MAQLPFTIDTAKSGYIIKKTGFAVSYQAVAGDGKIGVDTSPGGFDIVWEWCMVIVSDVSIPAGATVTEVAVDLILDASQPSGSFTKSNRIWAHGSGGIIGVALNGTAAEYAGTGGTQLQDWAANGTDEYLIFDSDIHALITPGTPQQLDIVMPQLSYLGGDDGGLVYDFNGKVPSKVYISYDLGNIPRKMLMGVGL